MHCAVSGVSCGTAQCSVFAGTATNGTLQIAGSSTRTYTSQRTRAWQLAWFYQRRSWGLILVVFLPTLSSPSTHPFPSHIPTPVFGPTELPMFCFVFVCFVFPWINVYEHNFFSSYNSLWESETVLWDFLDVTILLAGYTRGIVCWCILSITAKDTAWCHLHEQSFTKGRHGNTEK